MRVPARPRADPFFRICGGKRKLVPELLRLAPPTFGAYREPFVGAGALFFALAPYHAHLSDVNPDLVAAYQGVRDCADEVVNRLWKMNTDADGYKLVQAAVDLELVGRAARFLYLQLHSFNGLWRTNAAGKHNAPRDASKKVDLGRYEVRLRAASAALRGVDVRERDFEDAMLDARSGDLVYCDPPYVPVSETSNFVGYAAGGFTEHDQRRLRDAARTLKRRGVHVLLSNSNAPLVRELYSGGDFEITEVLAARSVNSKGDRRGMVKEVVIR